MIKKYIIENKKIILGIILSPFAMYIFNTFVMFLFNIGTYFGTYLRYVYSNIVC